ncbi:MAG TPA: DMT family transporter [Methanobacterium sp.]|nr:DMT family transporter [Methanobacterium sp.]
MDRIWGYWAALTVAILFGLWFTLDKILLTYLHPIVLAALTYLIACVTLLAITASPFYPRVLRTLHGNKQVEKHISQKDYLILFFTAIFGAVIAPILSLYGLSQITAVNASLLANAEMLFIIIIGIFFLKEKFKRNDLVAFAFIILGILSLSTNNFQNISLSPNLYGNFLVIAAAFFWSLDTSLSKFLSKKRDIVFITGIKCIIGGIILITVSMLMGLDFNVHLAQLPLLLMVSMVCLSFSLVLIYFSIREIGSTRTGSIYALSSLFGAIIAFLILKEPLYYYQLFFGFLMLLGVFILYKNQQKSRS